MLSKVKSTSLNQHAVAFVVSIIQEFVPLFLQRCPYLSACGAKMELTNIIGSARQEKYREESQYSYSLEPVC